MWAVLGFSNVLTVGLVTFKGFGFPGPFMGLELME